MAERIFKKVVQKHLDVYLPECIEKYGHAILHGDGNVYVDEEGVQKEHQRSYIAKIYAGVGNEVATYRVKFTSESQLPKTLEKLDKMLMDAKAKEAFEEDESKLTDNFKSIGGKADKKIDQNKVLEDENASLKAELTAKEEAAKKEAEAKESELKAKEDENAKLQARIKELEKAANKPAKAADNEINDQK